jgi:molybdopterin synthase catalytic subunit
MLRTASDLGIPAKNWDAAKEEARSAMITRARVRGMIPYSDLVKEISAVKFRAHDTRLFHMLGEISVEENEAGRGMLSVVVVHKHGDMQPGPGFFLLGQHLGHDTKDLLKFWVDQLKKVHAQWSKRAATPVA